mmetsp:Transcript_60593/g.141909  ORF Transcript_60593/g.141909 Transcript_60593/m.141909 type:complete len:221 (-) Transcript_60593:613-1275(-)
MAASSSCSTTAFALLTIPHPLASGNSSGPILLASALAIAWRRSLSIRFCSAVARRVTAACFSMSSMKTSSPRSSSIESTSALLACSSAIDNSSKSIGVLASAPRRNSVAACVGDAGWSLRSTEKFLKDTFESGEIISTSSSFGPCWPSSSMSSSRARASRLRPALAVSFEAIAKSRARRAACSAVRLDLPRRPSATADRNTPASIQVRGCTAETRIAFSI